MASPQAVTAILRAVRPRFRSRHDKLAFGVHAFMLSDGFKLLACGPAADGVQEVRPDAPEVGLDGWTGLDGAYAFAYADAAGKREPVLVKALAMGDRLVVHSLALGSSRAEPRTAELDVGRFTTDSQDPAAALQHVDALLRELGKALGAPAAAAPRAERSRADSSGLREDPPAQPHPGQLPVLPGNPGSSHPDLLPAGLPSSIGGVPGLLRGPEPLAGVPSGMHLGPHDPLFAGRPRGQPGVGLPEGVLPGARWDPVAPPGMEGFHAGDFQRGPGRQQGHPDIMPPGPGRGADYDRMFG